MKLPSPVRPRKSRIVIIPLIDIMFFLLASFMMVSLQMSRTANIQVRLPEASQARRDFQPDMMQLAVDARGAVWLAHKEISLPELTLAVSNRFKANPHLPVFISGDRDTLHGKMVGVYQAVRAGGVQEISFMASDTPDSDKP